MPELTTISLLDLIAEIKKIGKEVDVVLADVETRKVRVAELNAHMDEIHAELDRRKREKIYE